MEKIIRILTESFNKAIEPIKLAKTVNLQACILYIEKTFEFSPPTFAEKFIHNKQALDFFKKNIDLFKEDADFVLVTLRNFYKFSIYHYYYTINESDEKKHFHFNGQDPIWVKAKEKLTSTANLDSIEAIRKDLENFSENISNTEIKNKKKKKNIFKSILVHDKKIPDKKISDEKMSGVLDFNKTLLETLNMCDKLQLKLELKGFGESIKIKEDVTVLESTYNLDEDWNLSEETTKSKESIAELDKSHESSIYHGKDKAPRTTTTKLENLFDFVDKDSTSSSFKP